MVSFDFGSELFKTVGWFERLTGSQRSMRWDEIAAPGLLDLRLI
jgi:hypothetical protein